VRSIAHHCGSSLRVARTRNRHGLASGEFTYGEFDLVEIAYNVEH
jgi:hypothetical protein